MASVIAPTTASERGSRKIAEASSGDLIHPLMPGPGSSIAVATKP